jgi:hypothetical protein
MPKIQWTNLPPALGQHLFNRLEDRQITGEDLYKLKLWRESEPEAPNGSKDFGSFKVCGEANFPRQSRLKGGCFARSGHWRNRCSGCGHNSPECRASL